MIDVSMLRTAEEGKVRPPPRYPHHAQVRDAVRCHFDEGKQPKVVRLHFVREEVISVVSNQPKK